MENFKKSKKELFELTSEFNNVTRYKVNIQKSMVFLYISNEQLKIEVIENCPLQIN